MSLLSDSERAEAFPRRQTHLQRSTTSSSTFQHTHAPAGGVIASTTLSLLRLPISFSPYGFSVPLPGVDQAISTARCQRQEPHAMKHDHVQIIQLSYR